MWNLVAVYGTHKRKHALCVPTPDLIWRAVQLPVALGATVYVYAPDGAQIAVLGPGLLAAGADSGKNRRAEQALASSFTRVVLGKSDPRLN